MGKVKKTNSQPSQVAVGEVPAEVTLAEVLVELRRVRVETVDAVGKVEKAVKDGFNTMRKVMFRNPIIAKRKADGDEDGGETATVAPSAGAGVVDVSALPPMIGHESEVSK